MLEIDKNDIIINQIDGGRHILNYFNADNLKIKYFGKYININEYNVNKKKILLFLFLKYCL